MNNQKEDSSTNIADLIANMPEEQVNKVCARLLTEYMYNSSLSPEDILKAILDI